MSARFLIGIDLGTTNSAVAFVDTASADRRVGVFEIPQLVAPGEIAARRQLPSFVYLASEIDLAPHETTLPWQARVMRAERDPQAATSSELRPVVGELARTQGARMASRMIASAKSWLCHPGVDRSAPILPWGRETEGGKLSPIAAQSLVLAHVREAWDHAHPDAPFTQQEILVTVPASFDEAARDLTLQAATRAGYPPVALLEEPQAAFYAWVDQTSGGKGLKPGERVLVFDVGGGTTDFTLIDVDAEGFTRSAVGDHLLLGGDNLDLTLAKIVEQRLVAKNEKTGKKLDALQWHGLVHACRLAKETLLADPTPGSSPIERAPIVVQARGAKLIGGSLRDEITRAELEQILHDGFFPQVARDAQLSKARGGLQEFGLPYANDPAVTRHLASFLSRHEATRVDAVLFNGGAMTPASLRARVLDQIGAWQDSRPRELPADMPEMAVAQGAAYYGLVRRGLAARIRGGTPRAFYIGVESTAGKMAACLAPAGLYEVVTNRPVSFKLYSSSTRHDQPGALVPIGDGRAETLDDGSDLQELPPIVTVIRARRRAASTESGRMRRPTAEQPTEGIGVHLEVHITELGALEIACVDQDGETYKLGFDMRSGGARSAASSAALNISSLAAGAAGATTDPHPRLDEAKAMLAAAFTTGAGLATIARDLETLLDGRRDEWSTMTARALFDTLIEVAAERKKTADHEHRWLNLAGFLLRPGTGAPLDTWRARVMWGVFNENLAFPKAEPNKLAWWIAWRRIAGGLAKGQQAQFFDRLSQLLLPSPKQQKKLAEVKPSKQELAEMWRVIGSLERLSASNKGKLGDELIRRMELPKGLEDGVHLWALSRLGARVPLYGPLDAIVPASKIGSWLGALLTYTWPEPEKAALALAQLGRRTGDRSRDLDDATRARLATALRAMPGGDRAAVLVEEIVALDAREELVVFGDTLPAGLRIVLDDDLPPADS
ncbi:MAG: hsp70 family protein [Proteobacteria bacterium]|nr:hsp70 family protein [Pseudomonadota bacterium]